MQNRVIVNCSIGEHYRALRPGVETRCLAYGDGAALKFYSHYPPGCPPHHEAQYAFKIFALYRAIVEGADTVLWIDSTFKPRASMRPLWDHIEAHGWYAPPQGNAMLSEFSSDDALRIFGITREQARSIKLVYSGLVGLDINAEIGHTIWSEWYRLYQAGAFNGAHCNGKGPMRPWGNKFIGHVSDDPAVSGHRHDEAALSYALWKFNLDPVPTGFLTVESEEGFIERHFDAN